MQKKDDIFEWIEKEEALGYREKELVDILRKNGVDEKEIDSTLQKVHDNHFSSKEYIHSIGLSYFIIFLISSTYIFVDNLLQGIVFLIIMLKLFFGYEVIKRSVFVRNHPPLMKLSIILASLFLMFSIMIIKETYLFIGIPILGYSIILFFSNKSNSLIRFLNFVISFIISLSFGKLINYVTSDILILLGVKVTLITIFTPMTCFIIGLVFVYYFSYKKFQKNVFQEIVDKKRFVKVSSILILFLVLISFFSAYVILKQKTLELNNALSTPLDLPWNQYDDKYEVYPELTQTSYYLALQREKEILRNEEKAFHKNIRVEKLSFVDVNNLIAIDFVEDFTVFLSTFFVDLRKVSNRESAMVEVWEEYINSTDIDLDNEIVDSRNEIISLSKQYEDYLSKIDEPDMSYSMSGTIGLTSDNTIETISPLLSKKIEMTYLSIYQKSLVNIKKSKRFPLDEPLENDKDILSSYIRHKVIQKILEEKIEETKLNKDRVY